LHQPYPSDVSDAEWARVEPIITAARDRRGRSQTYELRDLFDAMLYVFTEGCRWRSLPGDFPDWNLVYQTAKRWAARGVLHAALGRLAPARELRLRGKFARVKHGKGESLNSQRPPQHSTIPCREC